MLLVVRSPLSVQPLKKRSFLLCFTPRKRSCDALPRCFISCGQAQGAPSFLPYISLKPGASALSSPLLEATGDERVTGEVRQHMRINSIRLDPKASPGIPQRKQSCTQYADSRPPEGSHTPHNRCVGHRKIRYRNNPDGGGSIGIYYP